MKKLKEVVTLFSWNAGEDNQNIIDQNKKRYIREKFEIIFDNYGNDFFPDFKLIKKIESKEGLLLMMEEQDLPEEVSLFNLDFLLSNFETITKKLMEHNKKAKDGLLLYIPELYFSKIKKEEKTFLFEYKFHNDFYEDEAFINDFDLDTICIPFEKDKTGLKHRINFYISSKKIVISLMEPIPDIDNFFIDAIEIKIPLLTFINSNYDFKKALTEISNITIKELKEIEKQFLEIIEKMD